MSEIQLLDCTLRDGAYIVDADFGVAAMKGIIKKMQDANIDIIECGWLKNSAHKLGTSFFHVPSELQQYLVEKRNTIKDMVPLKQHRRTYLMGIWLSAMEILACRFLIFPEWHRPMD